MKYYKLMLDMSGKRDVIFHYEDDYGIGQNELNKGVYYEKWDDRFCFYFDENEGDIWTDFIANDKGWLIVSEKLKFILERAKTSIQFIKLNVKDYKGRRVNKKYYIANIIKKVDALCLDKSEYFTTYIKGIGEIYTVSKYGVYEEKVEQNDIFKLKENNQVPIFISDKLKKAMENNGVTGFDLVEINVK
ncbi:hypothetical protein SAMN05216390_11332 [Lachnospiraceae bacterium KH1T2]|nr:hypothetical protein SAMN05216390_11332 [Lachnospiraceae bacterium KH1T2]